MFDPEAIGILVAAFDDAWAKFQAGKAPSASDDYAAAERTIIAEYIISAARDGLLDRRQLIDGALLYLSQRKLS